MNEVKASYHKNGLTFTVSGNSFVEISEDLYSAVEWMDKHPVDTSVNYFTAGSEVTGT